MSRRVEDLGRGHHLGLRCGQLDGQRNPIEAMTQRREPPPRSCHPMRSSPRASSRARRTTRPPPTPARTPRRPPPAARGTPTARCVRPGTPNASRLVARIDRRAACAVVALTTPTRADQMLAVVEHQQQVLALQELREALSHRHALRRRVTNRGGDRVRQVVGIQHLCELTEPYAVGHTAATAPIHLECQRASCPPPLHRRSKPPATTASDPQSTATRPRDRRSAQLVGQVRAVRIERPQRRESTQAGPALDLEQMHGRLQIAKPMLAKIDEPDPISHLHADNRAAHDLAPMRHSPSRGAARFTSAPNQSPSRWVASPVCRPMRTRSSSPAGHTAARNAACAATAAATPSCAVENAAWNPSPVVFTT